MQAPPNAYLESEVNTATPQRLRLMLIEGALRFARLTRNSIDADNDAESCEAASRCRSIISELIGSIHDPENELHQRIIALYVFVFQRVTEGQLAKDTQFLDDAIGVLELERETWQEICRKHPEKIVGELPPVASKNCGSQEAIPPIPAAIPPENRPATGSTFSMDA